MIHGLLAVVDVVFFVGGAIACYELRSGACAFACVLLALEFAWDVRAWRRSTDARRRAGRSDAPQ